MIEPRINSRRNLFSLCLASFIIISGYSVIVPFLPIYANDFLTEFDLLGFTFGIGLQIGIIAAGNLVMKLFLAPAYGDLSDITGRKPIIVIGMAAYTLLMAGYGFASDFLSLFILRVLSGVASAAVWPVGQALVADTASKENIGKYLGFYMLSMMLGVTTGPFLAYGSFSVLTGTGFTEIDSYRLTFVSVAVLGLVATLAVTFSVTDPVTENKRLSKTSLYWESVKLMAVRTLRSPIFLYRTLSTAVDYRTRSVKTIYAVAIVNGFATALLVPIVPLVLEEYYLLDAGSIALVIGIVGVLSILGAPTGGVISDQIGRKKTVWSSGFACGFVIFLLGFKTSILLLVVIFALLRFLFTVMQPSFRALQSDLVPEEVRGKEFGIVDAAFNFGSVLGPVFGGYLYDLFYLAEYDLGYGLVFTGAGTAFAVSGLLLILANLLLLLLVNQKQVITGDRAVKLVPN
ncbi:MAG: MFS transporter [Candidatus Odinarchaeota archaeon]